MPYPGCKAGRSSESETVSVCLTAHCLLVAAYSLYAQIRKFGDNLAETERGVGVRRFQAGEGILQPIGYTVFVMFLGLVAVEDGGDIGRQFFEAVTVRSGRRIRPLEFDAQLGELFPKFLFIDHKSSSSQTVDSK